MVNKMTENDSKKYKYDLGILGGMGSEATVEIYKRIISKTYHTCDQDHMKICILNNSIIPDRTDCILNGGDSPLPYLNESIKDLESLSCKYFVVACNTAHYFADEFKFNNIKFISMVESTLEYINQSCKQHKVCILSTTGTVKTKVYHNHNLAKNINFVFPNEIEQDIIMSVINETKKGISKEILTKKIEKVVLDILSRYNDVVFVLACTELSLYFENICKLSNTIDAMECLIKNIFLKCGYKMK